MLSATIASNFSWNGHIFLCNKMNFLFQTIFMAAQPFKLYKTQNQIRLAWGGGGEDSPSIGCN